MNETSSFVCLSLEIFAYGLLVIRVHTSQNCVRIYARCLNQSFCCIGNSFRGLALERFVVKSLDNVSEYLVGV